MKKKPISYRDSGVDISLGNKFVSHIRSITKKNVQKTSKSNYINNIGSFGSSYDISNLNIKDPLIVSCTD
jgi:phosphoribosylformylglycinamidine cyclo-ligase